jgi:ATP-binding cassette subfamily B protein
MAGVALPERPLAEIIAERRRLTQLVGWSPWPLTAVLVAAHVLTAVSPVLLAVATGGLVAALSATEVTVNSAGAAVAFFVGVLFARQVGELTADTAGLVVAREIDRRVRRTVRQVALAPPGIERLAEPSYQDELRRASDQGFTFRVRSPGTAATGQLRVVFRMSAAIAATVLLARFSVALAVGLLVGSLLMRAVLRTQWMELAAMEDRFAPEKRAVTYWTDLVTAPGAAKEIRLFGLGDWVATRRHVMETGWVFKVWRRKDTVYRRQGWLAVIAAVIASAALLAPGLAAANGAIGVDDLATYLAAARAVFAISYVGHEAFDIEYGVRSLQALDRLLTGADGAVDPGVVAKVPPPNGLKKHPPTIVFAGVGFGYPGTGLPLLAGLDLTVRPGEVLAVVGVNGAGKTTMMKLLAGLLQPTAGRILIDGVDLASMDTVVWRRRLSVLFQDFVHYPLSADRNVSLGAGDKPLDDAAVRTALRDAGATALIDELPSGGDTPLTRIRRGGVDLSGGQWQRLALARVLYAVRQGADVVVLDEPTAHLDVHAEAEFFDEVITKVADATVVVISHRLSTVRHADRIVLVDGGRVTESGSHDELLAQQGVYARMFQLQSARFHDAAEAS